MGWIWRSSCSPWVGRRSQTQSSGPSWTQGDGPVATHLKNTTEVIEVRQAREVTVRKENPTMDCLSVAWRVKEKEVIEVWQAGKTFGREVTGHWLPVSWREKVNYWGYSSENEKQFGKGTLLKGLWYKQKLSVEKGLSNLALWKEGIGVTDIYTICTHCLCRHSMACLMNFPGWRRRQNRQSLR